MDFSQFSWESFWKFSKISQNFPTIGLCRPSAGKIYALAVKVGWKIG